MPNIGQVGTKITSYRVVPHDEGCPNADSRLGVRRD